MPIVTLRDLYVAELQDLYDVEQQVLQVLPGMAARATSGELRTAFEQHYEQTQVHIDDASGVVDFAQVIARLDDLGYQGKLSIEYFNLPEHGWPLDDPVGWATDLAAHLRPLLAGVRR